MPISSRAKSSDRIAKKIKADKMRNGAKNIPRPYHDTPGGDEQFGVPLGPSEGARV
jgi:hypothetical protein